MVAIDPLRVDRLRSNVRRYDRSFPKRGPYAGQVTNGGDALYVPVIAHRSATQVTVGINSPTRPTSLSRSSALNRMRLSTQLPSKSGLSSRSSDHGREHLRHVVRHVV